jgi:ribonucleoside-diphosphate reductase alpha chain
MAYHLDCKGVTVYRYNSRPEQVLNKGSVVKEEKTKEKKEKTPLPRPDLTRGTTRKMKTGCGNLYVTINEDAKGIPFELFSQMGKAGGCAASQIEAISRLISYSLRCGANISPIITQLKGIRCHQVAWDKGNQILSCADAIGQAIETYIAGKDPNNRLTNHNSSTYNEIQRGACPDCGGMLTYAEGCIICKCCGYSECK